MLTRREFLVTTAATSLAAVLPAVSGPAPAPAFGAFTDLAGTIPAKAGDLVACIKPQVGPILTQPDATKRPVMHDGYALFEEGEFLSAQVWQPDGNVLICDFSIMGCP